MAEALQDLITKNAKNNEIDDDNSDDQETKGEQDAQGSDTNKVKYLWRSDSDKKGWQQYEWRS